MNTHVVIIGGSLTGNKGAASMVLAVLDRVRADDADAKVTVLSPLAADDVTAAADAGVELAAFGPVDIVLAVLGALVSRLSLGRLQPGSATQALRSADVVADVSGISFVDGRGMVTLAYNVLLVLPALILGRPVVKIAQAMGPFEERLNRAMARLVLPRMAGLLARGPRTQEHLDQLGVASDGTAADVAFLMEVTADDEAWAESVAGDVPFVCVAPSQVVLDQATPLGLDYLGHVVAVVDALSEERDVVLVAHSARPGAPASRLNDIPLCQEVLARVTRPERCRLAPVDASPRQLRALIGRSQLLVASRFHAMISGLAMSVPVLIIGWSHKYREVLSAFGLEDLAVDFRSEQAQSPVETVRAVLPRLDEVHGTIGAGLPAVISSASTNLDQLRACATPRDRSSHRG